MASKCLNCEGSGKKEIVLFLSKTIETCEICKGTGFVATRCPKCNKNNAKEIIGFFGNIVSPCQQCEDKDTTSLDDYAKMVTSSWYMDYK